MGIPSASQTLSIVLTARSSHPPVASLFLPTGFPFPFPSASSVLIAQPLPTSLHSRLLTGFPSHRPHRCPFLNLHSPSRRLSLPSATSSAWVCPFVFPHPQSVRPLRPESGLSWVSILLTGDLETLPQRVGWPWARSESHLSLRFSVPCWKDRLAGSPSPRGGYGGQGKLCGLGGYGEPHLHGETKGGRKRCLCYWEALVERLPEDQDVR